MTTVLAWVGGIVGLVALAGGAVIAALYLLTAGMKE